jgi:hypothetical protein
VKDGEVFLDSAELMGKAVDQTRPIAGPARRASVAA